MISRYITVGEVYKRITIKYLEKMKLLFNIGILTFVFVSWRKNIITVMSVKLTNVSVRDLTFNKTG